MRLVLLGSGAFGLPTFKSLAAEHEILMVMSQPDRPAGRKRILTPTPVSEWALSQGLALSRCENANEPAMIARLAELNADAAVVIAFGQKLSPALIEALGSLVINLHASLLPKYRGAAPINWAMIRGEQVTGNSVIALAQKMDAGVVFGQNQTPIDPLETAGELHDRLAEMGPQVISQVLAHHVAGTLVGHQQDEQLATLAPKLAKEDGWIDWSKPAHEIRCFVHGMTPWPGARTNWLPDANVPEQTTSLTIKRVRDLSDYQHDTQPGTLLDEKTVAAGTGAVELLELQAPGKRSMTISDFLHGHALTAGQTMKS